MVDKTWGPLFTERVLSEQTSKMQNVKLAPQGLGFQSRGYSINGLEVIQGWSTYSVLFLGPVNCCFFKTTGWLSSGSVTGRPFCEPSVMMWLYNAIPTRGQHLVDVDTGLIGHRHMSLTKQLSDFPGRESNPQSSDHGSNALTIRPSKLPSYRVLIGICANLNGQITGCAMV